MTDIAQPSVKLRPVEPDDLHTFFLHQQEPEAVWMAAFTAKDPSDNVQFKAHWNRIMADNTIVIRTITAEGQIIGHVLKYPMDGRAEVSYWLGKAYWGQGLATVALQLFLQDMLIRPVYARTASDNHASMRVLEKCGFHVVGKDKGYAQARDTEIAEVSFARHE